MASLNEFSALRKVINEQLDRFESEIQKANFPLPQTTPAELHPLDDPFYLPTTDLFQAREQLVGALGMMQACVQAPAERLMSASFSHHLTSSLSLVLKAGVPQALKELGPNPVSVSTLGPKVKVESDKLLRVMRFLSNQNIFNENSEGSFTHNRTSLLLLPGSPIANFTSFQTWYSLMGSSELADTLLDPKRGPSYEPKDSALAKAADFEGLGVPDMWQYLGKYHQKRVEEFGNAMTALGSVGVSGILSDYPWKDLPKGTVIVDVGGGEGAMLLPILKAFPHLSGIVQDRPETVPLAKKNFETNLPEAIKENRVEFEAMDFFQGQPRKGDQYLYMLRWVIHDYGDENSIKILKHLKDVMTPKSKILVIDTVMQPALIGDKDGKTPFPVPKSLGNGGLLRQQVGYEMLQAVNAKERTPKEFSDLFEASGLKLVKVWDCRAPHGVVEATLK